MNHIKFFAATGTTFAALAAIAGSFAIADPSDKPQPAASAELKLPPGWTPEDMQACAAAATPGKMHEYLAESAGVWRGKNTMWMAPGAEPVKSESTTTITPMLGGRFYKAEMTGTMPGSGAYKGQAIYGYDNVSKQFVATWVDNMGTGIANGLGKLSEDEKTLTWTYTYNCPITKKPTVMREVETATGPDTKTLVMFGTDPKSGKEFKMMEIKLTRENKGQSKESASASGE